MSQPITSLMYDPGPNLFYDPAVRVTIESHLAFMRSHSAATVVAIDPQAADKYEGDLQGLLMSMGYPMDVHFIIMRLNDYNTFTQFRSDTASLLIPPPDVVSNIRQLSNTAQGRQA